MWPSPTVAASSSAIVPQSMSASRSCTTVALVGCQMWWAARCCLQRHHHVVNSAAHAPQRNEPVRWRLTVTDVQLPSFWLWHSASLWVIGAAQVSAAATSLQEKIPRIKPENQGFELETPIERSHTAHNHGRFRRLVPTLIPKKTYDSDFAITS